MTSYCRFLTRVYVRKQQHLHSNLSLSLCPEQRALTHRDQDAETGCINNTADDGNQFLGKSSHLPPQLEALVRSDGHRTKHPLRRPHQRRLHHQCLHRQRLDYHQSRATGNVKCVIFLQTLYVKYRIFSFELGEQRQRRVLCMVWRLRNIPVNPK